MIQYAKDRDKAFSDFVMDDDFSHIEKLIKKYGIEHHFPSMEIAKAAIYKAVQECTNISQEVKDIAREKCIALGFKPTMF